MFRRGPGATDAPPHLVRVLPHLRGVVQLRTVRLTIGKQFGLGKAQLVTLGLCNLALTVPARIIIGGLLDRFGPRRTFSAILLYAAIPCLLFATAQSFDMLVVSRLMIGVVGAGFVVGIRMVSEWFPPDEVGTAEGVYGGWGNFGAAAAALALPLVAAAVGGPDGWRWADRPHRCDGRALRPRLPPAVDDTPERGAVCEGPRRPPRSRSPAAAAVCGLIALSVPLAVALGVIAWRIWKVGVISSAVLGVASPRRSPCSPSRSPRC